MKSLNKIFLNGFLVGIASLSIIGGLGGVVSSDIIENRARIEYKSDKINEETFNYKNKIAKTLEGTGVGAIATSSVLGLGIYYLNSRKKLKLSI